MITNHLPEATPVHESSRRAGRRAASGRRDCAARIRELIPGGLRGFIFAAIAGAVISTLASLLNSASAIFTIDVYKRILKPDASGRSTVRVARGSTLVAIVIGCRVAPLLANPKFGGGLGSLLSAQCD